MGWSQKQEFHQVQGLAHIPHPTSLGPFISAAGGEGLHEQNQRPLSSRHTAHARRPVHSKPRLLYVCTECTKSKCSSPSDRKLRLNATPTSTLTLNVDSRTPSSQRLSVRHRGTQVPAGCHELSKRELADGSHRNRPCSSDLVERVAKL